MAKKKRRNTRKKEWIRKAPDEVLRHGPIQIERYGRFLRYSNASTPKEHADFLKRIEEAHAETREDLEKEVRELQTLLKIYDPVELMHRAAYMLMPVFMKYRSENEYSFDETFYLPAVEYLQYLIARTEMKGNGKKPSESEWEELWKRTMKAMQDAYGYILTRKPLDGIPKEINELRFYLDGRRLMIRGDRYSFFLGEYLQASLAPYEQWIKEIYNVEVGEIIEGLEKINEYERRGVLGRYREAMGVQGLLMEDLMKKGYSVDPDAPPEEIERTREAIASEEFKPLRDELQEKMRLTFTPAIFEITDLTSLPQSVLSLLSIKPGEAILTTLTGPEHEDLSPLSTSVLHYKPFMEVSGKYYTFYHSGLTDRVDDIIEADLFQKRANKIPVMAKRRSDHLESETKNLLESIIRPDFAFQNIYYPNPDEEGSLTELDILIGVDDVLFIVEAKAGGISVPASRGAPKSLEEDLRNLIIEGQHQSERAERYIRSDDEVAFFDETGKSIVHKVRHAEYRETIRIVVTRKQLGWVGAKIAVLSIIDPSLSKSIPWHVSIDDLRIVAELFRDKEVHFVHFLEQRLRAAAETTLSQYDEIEHIGLYNTLNHYYLPPVEGMSRITYDSSYMRDIDYYFSEKSAGGQPEVPAQDMPSKMRDFILALRKSRLAGRFEAGSIILSMDETGRDEFQDVLNTLEAGLKEGRQRTFRLPFARRSYGISITSADAAHWQEELTRSAAQMEASGCERWLVVQMRGMSPYRIGRIEVIIPGRFTEEEIAASKLRLEEKVRSTIAKEKIGRNEQCPCGSGKKFKRCHGLNP